MEASPASPMDETLMTEIDAVREAGLFRSPVPIRPLGGCRARLGNGREVTVFASNDYLSLSRHPDVVQGAMKALVSHGAGSPASRMMTGSTDLHEALEKRIAEFKGRQAARLFPSGYMANLGFLQGLFGENDGIFSDERNHASIVDGCRLSRAAVFVYPHGDVQALDGMLERCGISGRRLIVTDAVFSMEGDLAHLPELRATADRHGAWLAADEAHAAGIVGPTGHGIEEAFGLPGSLDIQVGTLGKALGVAGGFVAGSQALIEALDQTARTNTYTTAAPPPLCAALMKSLDLLDGHPEWADRLRGKATRLRRALVDSGVSVLPGETPIVIVPTGSADRAMALSASLLEGGYLVTAIRPPTVPPSECRLRISVNLGHDDGDIDGLAQALARVIHR